MSTIIEMNDLVKEYDGLRAVDQLTLSIKKGEVFGLLGPNGAGKSTTILMILGLIEPTSGTITVNGIPSLTQPIEVKKKVGYLPDNLGFYENMTGLENLMYTASLNGMTREAGEKRALELLDRVGLSDAAHKKAGKYSRGMKQRLGLADVLMKDPEIIILDEPTLGIDPEGVREILALIKELNEEQKLTVLLSSHHLHQVQQICDRVGIFVKGKLLAKGRVNELADQLFSKEAYVVQVKAEPITGDLIKALEKIDHVTRVEKIDVSNINIYSQEKNTPEIARTLFDHKVDVENISLKNYGLDEIYHRYFEGREADEDATVNAI